MWAPGEGTGDSGRPEKGRSARDQEGEELPSRGERLRRGANPQAGSTTEGEPTAPKRTGQAESPAWPEQVSDGRRPQVDRGLTSLDAVATTKRSGAGSVNRSLHEGGEKRERERYEWEPGLYVHHGRDAWDPGALHRCTMACAG
jgi:hypothetical protein